MAWYVAQYTQAKWVVFCDSLAVILHHSPHCPAIIHGLSATPCTPSKLPEDLGQVNISDTRAVWVAADSHYHNVGGKLWSWWRWEDVRKAVEITAPQVTIVFVGRHYWSSQCVAYRDLSSLAKKQLCISKSMPLRGGCSLRHTERSQHQTRQLSISSKMQGHCDVPQPSRPFHTTYSGCNSTLFGSLWDYHLLHAGTALLRDLLLRRQRFAR